MKFGLKACSLKALCAAGAGLLLSASAAIAQTNWDAIYNVSSTLNAAARGGILHFSDNSSISVGETIGSSGTSDIFVVHQAGTQCGDFDWAFTYHIGGNDVGRKIRRTSDGGYIVVGTTQNTGTGCTANDIFLLRLNSTGGVVWAKTYGGEMLEQGQDVQVLSNGDFAVAGFISSAGAGSWDAYLMRVTSAGVPVWGRAYGSANDDYFQSVEVAGNGDLIAAGMSAAYTPNGADMLLGRVNPTTGMPIFMYNYGTIYYEIAYRAIELAGGNIAMAGATRGFGSLSEGAIITTSSTGTLLNGYYYGGGTATGLDEFYDITQLSGGDLMVTGRFASPSGGFGGQDVYVGRVNSTTLVPVSQLLFGTSRDDQGWGITKSGTGNANGWMVAGVSPFPASTSITKMYVISRSSMTPIANCIYNKEISITHGPATFNRFTPDLPNVGFIQSCTVTPTFNASVTFQAGCSNCTPGMMPVAPAGGISEYRGPGSALQAAPGVNASVSSVDENAEVLTALYPNPVRSGGSFTLALPNEFKGAELIITDMAGRVIHSEHAAGSEISIATDGWSSGVYAVRLSRDMKTMTGRLVVTE